MSSTPFGLPHETDAAINAAVDGLIRDAEKDTRVPQCPRCGNEAYYEDAHHAEPDTGIAAFRGGWSCDACGWVREDDPPEDPEPWDEATGPCGPMGGAR